MTPTEAVATFRSEYGRLCQLAAEALARGVPFDTVKRSVAGHAFTGSGFALQSVKLRTQRGRVNTALAAAKTAGATDTLIILAGIEVKNAVEGEWMRKLPMSRLASA